MVFAELATCVGGSWFCLSAGGGLQCRDVTAFTPAAVQLRGDSNFLFLLRFLS